MKKIVRSVVRTIFFLKYAVMYSAFTVVFHFLWFYQWNDPVQLWMKKEVHEKIKTKNFIKHRCHISNTPTQMYKPCLTRNAEGSIKS